MTHQAPEEEATSKTGKKSKEDIESLKQALAEEKAKAESHLANWQRTQADFINYKRRSEQERGEIRRFANATLMLKILPILDDMERAFASMPARIAKSNWVEGVRLIEQNLKSNLKAQGLCRIETVGEKFDPNVHEAAICCAGEEGKVIQELEKGYKLHDKVLRPAKVAVGEGKEADQPEVENPQQAE